MFTFLGEVLGIFWNFLLNLEGTIDAQNCVLPDPTGENKGLHEQRSKDDFESGDISVIILKWSQEFSLSKSTAQNRISDLGFGDSLSQYVKYFIPRATIVYAFLFFRNQNGYEPSTSEIWKKELKPHPQFLFKNTWYILG